MLTFRIGSKYRLRALQSGTIGRRRLRSCSRGTRVKLLIVRDLASVGWKVQRSGKRVLVSPPTSYSKESIRKSMRARRAETLAIHSRWISEHIDLARQNLVSGPAAWMSPIEPSFEICRTQEQHDTFRIFRYYWSSPYSEYVGRRLRLLIRDEAAPGRPLIGIAALGSSIIHIPDRDRWVGWDKPTRTTNLIYTMDAYVLGAVPPYNYLLGGKLVSYLLSSNEIRAAYRKRYKGVVTQTARREENRLACVFTTSLYGRSSQYNRLKYEDRLLYIPIGRTRGFGTLHLTDETFRAMRGLLASEGISVTNRFGDGPLWRMRVIRNVAEVLGFDADTLLRHSFEREIYAVPLAHNSRAFLTGRQVRLRQYDFPLSSLSDHWHRRWLSPRKGNPEVMEAVRSFKPEAFAIPDFALAG